MRRFLSSFVGFAFGFSVGAIGGCAVGILGAGFSEYSFVGTSLVGGLIIGLFMAFRYDATRNNKP